MRVKHPKTQRAAARAGGGRWAVGGGQARLRTEGEPPPKHEAKRGRARTGTAEWEQNGKAGQRPNRNGNG